MRAFKDSGIQWLGEIPEHWEIKPLRAILNQRNEQNNDLKLQTILSLVKDIGIIPYEEKGNVGNKSKNDLQGYKIARINDLVLNKMNAVIGSLGVSVYNGLVSPIYLVFYIDNPKYLMSYYYYLFQIKSVQKFLKTFAYGIMEIRESIDYLDFKKMFLPTPPIEEQKAIADFLDSKCKQIESFVDKKQKLITLLNEKKQALINECVTKGLSALCHCKALTRHSKDSPSCHSEALAEESTLLCHSERSEESKNIETQDTESRSFAIAQHDRTEYKDSGIKHLGKIPSHWEIKKLKYIVSLQNQKSGNIDSLVASLPQNDEYLCHSNDSASSRHSDLERSEREESHKNNNTNFRIGLENIESKTGKYIPTSEIVFEEDGIKFENGDILFGKLRPYLAKVFLADRGGICVSEFLVLRTKGANNHFLKFLMLSPLFIDIVDSSTYGTKMPRANWEFIGNLKIPLPPIEEQKQIAEFLDSEISKIDSIIEKIKKQIELIKEYKSTLINQAVCGRINL